MSNPEDLLLIEDVVLVRQVCSLMTVAFDDAAVADYLDAQINRGLRPEQFARIWLHTHPGSSANPSPTDEETFARVFGGCDWAVMGILAQGGATYARLQFHTGPGGSLLIPVEVDYRRPFIGSDADAWAAEYDACVAAFPARSSRRPPGSGWGDSTTRRITPSRSREVPTLIVLLKSEAHLHSTLRALGDLGAVAKDAAPHLRELQTQSRRPLDDATRTTIGETLRAVTPRE